MIKGTRVWVVDDDDDIRGIFRELLSKEMTIEMSQDYCSAEAMLAALKVQSGPEVILLDVQMAGMSGVDAIPYVHQISPKTRVLMISTFFDATARRQALANGAVDYLPKGHSPSTLIEAIYSALRQPMPAADANQSVPKARAGFGTGC